MSKTRRVILKVVPVVLVGLLVISNVFGLQISDLPTGSGSGTLTTFAGHVWSTVARYMFASANDKADIKKQLIILVLGAVLVFGATSLLKVIMAVTNEVTPSAT